MGPPLPPVSQTIRYRVLSSLRNGAIPRMNLKEQKDSLEFYITVLFYELALPYPTIL